MKHSIYIRNFFMTAGIVLLSFLILGSMFFAWSYRLIMSERHKTMSQAADEVARYVTLVYESNALSAIKLRAVLTTISQISGLEIIITENSGVVVSTSDSELSSDLLRRVVLPEFLREIDTADSISKNTDLGGVYEETRYVYGVHLVDENGGVIGYLFVSSQSEAVVILWRQFTSVFLFISVIVLFLTFTVSFITTKKQAEPINEMAAAAMRFARGDYTVRVENAGRVDEIGQLTDAFNAMADSIERSESLRRDFIANVSHELKTPMTVISGFSDGLLDGTIPTDKQQKYLQVISSETKRLSRLVRNMLDMSRIQSSSPELLLAGSFDIAEIIRISLLSLGSKIDAKSLDVDAELPEEAIMTRGDKDAVTQVVYNLFDNAIKFAEDGSVLRVSLWKQGQKAYVSVEDTGETIPTEEMPLIFDRFHKTDRSRSEKRDGVGLGLYIVKTILDNHNEDIYVTSCGGVTKFTFTLTLAPAERR